MFQQAQAFRLGIRVREPAGCVSPPIMCGGTPKMRAISSVVKRRESRNWVSSWLTPSAWNVKPLLEHERAVAAPGRGVGLLERLRERLPRRPC